MVLAVSAGGVVVAGGDWDWEARSAVVGVDGSVIGACCVGGGGGGFVTCVRSCQDEISFVRFVHS